MLWYGTETALLRASAPPNTGPHVCAGQCYVGPVSVGVRLYLDIWRLWSREAHKCRYRRQLGLE